MVNGGSAVAFSGSNGSRAAKGATQEHDVRQLSTTRRRPDRGAAAAALLAPRGLAQSRRTSDRDAIRAAVDAGFEESVRRIQEWIALPTIAAGGLNIAEGAAYMAQLAREAGFQHVEEVTTSGVPGVFATLDAGAPRTRRLYFMYDVKQFDPKEWASPPLEARTRRQVLRQGHHGPRRGEPEGAGRRLPRRAACASRDAGRKLPVNLVLVAEGEEEIGSPNFHESCAGRTSWRR